MPRYQFLKTNESLNKQNFMQTLNQLLEETNKQPVADARSVKKVFDGMYNKSVNEKLNYFINQTKKYITPAIANQFMNQIGINADVIRDRTLAYWTNVLSNEYIEQNQQVNNLINFLRNKNQNRNTSLDEIKQRILPLIKDESKNKIKIDVINYINNDEIKNNFNQYLNYLHDNLTDEVLNQIGEDVNNYKSIYDYEIEDDLTNPIYDAQTSAAINNLRNNKMLEGKALNDNEINEYVDALNYANKLFGEPKFDINALIADKNEIDHAVTEEQTENLDNTIKELALDIDSVNIGHDNEFGDYPAVNIDKAVEFNTLRNINEFSQQNGSKAHLKELLYKIQELGFDKGNITGEQSNKIYGLEMLYNAGKKYKEAIANNDYNNIIKYAKEVKDVDSKIKEMLDLIKRNMPLDRDENFAIPANVDSIRNNDIPAQYRLDYAAVSHLAALNNIINLIKINNWDIDEFVEKPIEHLRELYDNKLRDNINPSIANKNLEGTDLIFNLGKIINNDVANISFAASRALEGMALFQKDRSSRIDNYARYKAFMKSVNDPYMIMQSNMNKVALNSRIDCMIINPKLSFDDLGIRYYDAKNLKIIEAKKNTFDEIYYLKERNESISNFKARIDESILKYIKNEAQLVIDNKRINVMHLNYENYINNVQKAATKYLLSRMDEKDDPAYQQIEGLIKNKKAYLDNLINSIPNNEKYAEYQMVKDIKDNPINISGIPYTTNNVDNVNKYADVLDGYDNYIRNNKSTIKNEASDFIKTDKNSINLIKKTYNNYIEAKRIYDNEVRKLFGNNPQNINNLANNKIKDAFIKQNQLLKNLEKYKEENLEFVKENIKDGTIPNTYLEDRKVQFLNNNYNDIPLFRSDNQFNRDDYLKFKYPNIYQTFSNDIKDQLFNEYKKLVAKDEYEFFLRRYLENKELSEIKDELAIVEEYEKGYTDIDNDLYKAKFIGISDKEIEDKEISSHINKFDEISYIIKKPIPSQNFKKTLDKELIEQLKIYNNAKGNLGVLKDLPSLKDVIDSAQKTTLEYLLLSKNIDTSTDEYKELNNFLIDGKNYINNLIKDEEYRLQHAQLPKLGFNISSFDIKDYEINNYADSLNEFKKYYDANKNKVLSTKTIEAENKNNEKLIEKYREYKILKDSLEANNTTLNDSIINSSNVTINEPLADISGPSINRSRISVNNPINDIEGPKIGNKTSTQARLEQAKKELDELIDDAKFKTNELYRDGAVSNDYVSMRMQRLDNYDFNLPTMFEINSMMNVDDYIKKIHPNNYNFLDDAEKEGLYNSYKMSCELQRKEQLAKDFLIEKGYAERHDNHADEYQKYLDNLLKDFKKENKADEEIIENLKHIDKEEKEEIKLEEKIQLNENNNINIKKADLFDFKEDLIIDDNDLFNKWINELNKIIKEEALNDNEDVPKYNLDNEAPTEWLDKHYDELDEKYGDNLPILFTKAMFKLDDDEQEDFKEIINDTKYEDAFFKDENELNDKQNEIFRNNLRDDLTEIDNNFDDFDDPDIEDISLIKNNK